MNKRGRINKIKIIGIILVILGFWIINYGFIGCVVDSLSAYNSSNRECFSSSSFVIQLATSLTLFSVGAFLIRHKGF